MKTDPFLQELVDSFDTWMRREGGSARQTSKLAPYPTLFSPVTIGGVALKNRVAAAPVQEPAELLARAAGGSALLLAGPADCGANGQGAALARWQSTLTAVHGAESKLFLALSAGLGRAERSQSGKRPVSASRIPACQQPDLLCRPLSDAALKRLLQSMVKTAVSAKNAGFDGVCLCGSEGLLLDQLTNPAYNRRRIGTFANWQRFGLDLVEKIRLACGPGFPILYRISLSAALCEAYGADGMARSPLKSLASGRTLEDALSYMENLVKAGTDAFVAELGGCETAWLAHPPAVMPAGCFLPLAKLVKERFERDGVRTCAGLPVPIASFGVLGYPDLAETALREGSCDFVLLDPALSADPAWPNKARAGRSDEITPRSETWDAFSDAPAPVQTKKRMAVVGAGQAGIRFAVTAAKRGHSVTLYEKRDHIGGRLMSESVPKIQYELRNRLSYLDGLLVTAQQDFGLDLRMRSDMSAPGLAAEGFDAIVFAVGAKDLTPKIDGLEKIPHVQAADLLLAPALLENVKKAVVLGGGASACETACYLSCEKGCDVTVVETQPFFMADSDAATRGYLLHVLKKAGVRLCNCAKAVGFDENHALIVQNAHKDVPDPYDMRPVPTGAAAEPPFSAKVLLLDAELVVLALGRRPDTREYLAAQQLRAVPELYLIGECAASENAERDAARLANTI